MDMTGIEAVLPDHEIRPVAMDDVPALYDLVERITTDLLGESDANEAEIRDDLTGAHFDIAKDTFIALDPTGRATAYGQGHDERTGAGWIDVYVNTALAPAKYDEVAAAGIAACAGRVAESVQARGVASVKLTANLYETETRMREAYERAGFAIETIYWRMLLVFDDSPPELPSLPEGYTIKQVNADDDAVMAQAFEVVEDTFSEHHGFEDAEHTLADYSNNWRSQESYDPSAWWFAYRGDELVGVLLGDDRRAEQGDGFIRSLGVRRDLRGLGIARALMLTSFAHWQAMGRRGVQLGVDTGNVTGATRLYESVGMRSIHSAIALQRSETY